ncbi:MAG: transcriptional regulator [Oscillatoria princeps RMCB-10]|jgi:DNA-binding phage protein|nr:transcriptional regulator [Oscillatoria princeps RMCB-10]
MPKSLAYHDFLISRLKDPSYAARYLETHFELEDGEDPDPELIRLALSHVAEALGELQMTPEQAKLHREKLDELLSQRGSEAIYNLGQWLNALGLKLTVAVCESAGESVTEAASSSEVQSEVPV